MQRRQGAGTRGARTGDDVAARLGDAVAKTVLAGAAALEASNQSGTTARALVNYLRGTKAPPAQPRQASGAGGRRHDTRPAYGLLAPLGPAWVAEVVERLVGEGYLERDAPDRAVISVSRHGKRMMRARHVGEDAADLLPRRPLLGSNPELEERLRALRRKLAREAGRPPYGIFSNATLAALAARRPDNLGELAAVPGFGEARLRQFGRRLLQEIRRASRVDDTD